MAINILVIIALVALAAYVIHRAIQRRRERKANPDCAMGCAGCTRCSAGKK